MKENILDAPFHESITDVLKKDEKILWSEQPRKKITFTVFDFVVLSFCFVLYLIYINFLQVRWFPILFGPVVLFMLAFIKIREFLDARNTFYAISQDRIFFQIKRNGIENIFSLPFEDIKQMVEINNAIHIRTTNPLNPFLENKDQSKSNPILIIQNIEDVSEVIRIFKKIKSEA